MIRPDRSGPRPERVGRPVFPCPPGLSGDATTVLRRDQVRDEELWRTALVGKRVSFVEPLARALRFGDKLPAALGNRQCPLPSAACVIRRSAMRDELRERVVLRPARDPLEYREPPPNLAVALQTAFRQDARSVSRFDLLDDLARVGVRFGRPAPAGFLPPLPPGAHQVLVGWLVRGRHGVPVPG